MPITINALPFTITVPGDYVLASDLTSSSHGITVLADNVNINLAGHTISGSREPNSEFYGINSWGHDHLTIRNGRIVGFSYGIYLSDFVDKANSGAELTGGGHLIEDMIITGSTFRGIRVEGVNNIVRDNVISRIGGSTLFENAYGFGIETFGFNTLIEHNRISEIRGYGTADVGEGVGICRRQHAHPPAFLPRKP